MNSRLTIGVAVAILMACLWWILTKPGVDYTTTVPLSVTIHNKPISVTLIGKFPPKSCFLLTEDSPDVLRLRRDVDASECDHNHHAEISRVEIEGYGALEPQGGYIEILGDSVLIAMTAEAAEKVGQ